MITKIIFRAALILCIWGVSFQQSSAQTSIHSAGEEATGTGGSVSFSVGQVFYSFSEAGAHSINQGVQQPFEISVVDGVNELSISIDAQLFPNPTTEWVNLRINPFELEGLKFLITSLDGKIVHQETVQGELTRIPFDHLPSSTYLLTIFSESKQLKTFKIIKP